MLIMAVYILKEVLRRISGPRKGKVNGMWRMTHSEILYSLNSLPNITGLYIEAAELVRVRAVRNAYKDSGRKISSKDCFAD
jgi:hypothetical protein